MELESSGEFSKSRKLLETCLQALMLKKIVEELITKDGVIGIGITAGTVGLIVSGFITALPRRSMDSHDKLLTRITVDGNFNATIRVRVAHRRDLPNQHRANTTWRIELVLIDIEGNKINCGLQGPHILNKFSGMVSEGATFKLKNLMIKPTDEFSSVNFPWTIQFGSRTVLTPVKNVNPYYISAFKFVEIPQIREDSESYKKGHFDVIGCVTGKEQIIEQLSRGKMSKRMNIMIEDIQGEKTHVTLWEEHATNVSAMLAENKDKPLILLIKNVKLKVFRQTPVSLQTRRKYDMFDH